MYVKITKEMCLCGARLLFLGQLSRDSMSVATDTCVSCSVLAGLWGLSMDHMAVLCDAMSVLGVDVAVGLLGFSCWCPGKIISSDLNVIVRELSELIIVHSEEFGFLCSAELETWDGVDSVCNKCGNYKCVGGAGYDIGDLNVKLFPVAVDETAGDDAGVDSIQTDNVIGTEERIKDEADHAGYTVFCHHVHTIINVNPELDC